LTLQKQTLAAFQLGKLTIDQAIENGSLEINGQREAFTELMGLLDTFPFWFNIVTP
jgi:alkyl sulfatase BDS1-like metallo-beta-lactamase superfamily hydrolase